MPVKDEEVPQMLWLWSCFVFLHGKWAIVTRKEMTGHFGEASLFMVHIKLYAKVKHLFTLIALYLSKSSVV